MKRKRNSPGCGTVIFCIRGRSEVRCGDKRTKIIKTDKAYIIEETGKYWLCKDCKKENEDKLKVSEK